MSEINLGALTDEAQQSKKTSAGMSGGSKEPVVVLSSMEEEDDSKLNGPKASLTRRNAQRLELIRLSDKSARPLSLSRLVNQIIEKFFSERSEQLATEVQSVFESLKK